MNWTMPYPCRSRSDSVRRINMSSEPGNESFFCALRPIPRILSLRRQDYASQVQIGEPSRRKKISGCSHAPDANRDTTRSITSSYDSLNRVAVAETTSTHATSPTNCWGEAYFYDNFTTAGGACGNLSTITSPSSAYTGCTGESLSVIVLNNNRLSGYGYDSPGNLNSGSGVSGISYNAENQLVAAVGVTYKYDGDGKRVQKSG